MMKKFFYSCICIVALICSSCETDAPSLRAVITGDATEMNSNSVVLHGIINGNPREYSHLKCGFMIATSHFDIVNRKGDVWEAELEGKNFQITLQNLRHGTKYYYAAYILIDHVEYKYGTIKKFTITKQSNEEENQPSFVAKPFSVGMSKKVYFSQGNLQYHPKKNVWRFAEKQTDCISYQNNYISPSYDGWIDAFGWGTGSNPTHTSTENMDYQTFVDWGVNSIGSDAPNTWRALRAEEWNYIVSTRRNAHQLKGVAAVDGVDGLILLPDDWVCPTGVTFKSGCHTGNYWGGYGDYQKITKDQWAKMSAGGAVFLPASGYREGSTMHDVRVMGVYWTPSPYYLENYVYSFGFGSGEIGLFYGYERYQGLSVRLVREL